MILLVDGKMNELGWNYKKGKARTEQENSKKLKGFKVKVFEKLRWNKKKGVLEKSKKGSRIKKLIWMD